MWKRDTKTNDTKLRYWDTNWLRAGSNRGLLCGCVRLSKQWWCGTVTDVRKAVPCFCTQWTALFNTSVVHVTMGLRLVPGTLAACCLWALWGTWYEAHKQQGVRVNAVPCLLFKITAQFRRSWSIEIDKTVTNIEIHFKCEKPFRSRTYKIKHQLTTSGHKNNKRWFLIKYEPLQKRKIH